MTFLRDCFLNENFELTKILLFKFYFKCDNYIFSEMLFLSIFLVFLHTITFNR